MATRPRPDEGTRARILDVAERLVQTRGFNGFSYADVAAELGITRAALHYHFAGKAELREALIERYAARFAEALAAIDAREAEPREQLAAYLDLYGEVLSAGRMCLCGMLAAEFHTLPEGMRAEVLRFFDDNERWVAGVLRRGRSAGELRFAGSPRDAARTIVSALEGAMLVARPFADPRRFRSAALQLLESLSAER